MPANDGQQTHDAEPGKLDDDTTTRQDALWRMAEKGIPLGPRMFGLIIAALIIVRGLSQGLDQPTSFASIVTGVVLVLGTYLTHLQVQVNALRELVKLHVRDHR